MLLLLLGQTVIDPLSEVVDEGRPNPIKSLLRSRKFLLLLLDTIISTILFVAGQYFPDALPNVEVVIGIYQPVFVALIAAIAYEDGQNAKAAAMMAGELVIEEDEPEVVG